MIPIYKIEKEAGLEEAIKNSLSIACISKINPGSIDQISQNNLDQIDKHPQLAVAKHDDQWDIFCFNDIMVSCGWNKNDDVFDPTELWLARKTPIFKKVNFEHDEKDIIGVITASLAVNFDGKIVADDSDEIPEKFDLVTSSVLYTRWEDENLQNRMDNIIKAIGNNELFVSMEVLFPKFDYELQDLYTGEASIIARTHKSAFLTKHLRLYGGSGEYNGKKIGRLLRNMVFSGKGIVKKPANERSIIINSVASVPEKKMADITDMVPKSDLAKAEAKLDKLQEELKTVVAETQKSEREKLEKQIAKLTVDLEDTNKKLEAKAKELSEKETALENAEKAAKAKEVEITEFKTKLEKIEKAQAKSARINKLIVAGVDSAKATTIADKWESVSDEQFEDIVELNKVAPTQAQASTEQKKPEQTVGNVDNSVVDPDPALGVQPTDVTETVIKSTAGWIAGFLGKDNTILNKK